MYTSEELNDIGAMLLSRGEIELAIEALGEAYSKDKRNPQIICNLANAYAANDELDLAKDYFELAIAIDENIFEANHSLGFIYLQKKDYLNAIKYLEKALAINTDNNLIINLAYAYRNIKGRLAKKYFEKAIEIEPEEVSHYFALANVYLDNLDYFKSIEILKKINTKFPEYSKAYVLLNYVYSETLEWKKQKKLTKKVNKYLNESLNNENLAIVEEPLMNIFRIDDPKTNLQVARKKCEEIIARWN